MDETIHIRRQDPEYPGGLEVCLGEETPAVLTLRGDPSILQTRTLALFCSRACPGDLASQAYDVAQHVRDAGFTAAGGFHSPMEKECLEVLLRSPHPVIVGLGRSLGGAKLPGIYHSPLTEGRLLAVSAFGPEATRVTRVTARARNRLLAALAESVFVAHAEAGSSTELFCREVLSWGKPLYVLESPHNQSVCGLGAIPVMPRSLRSILDR